MWKESLKLFASLKRGKVEAHSSGWFREVEGRGTKLKALFFSGFRLGHIGGPTVRKTETLL